MLKFWVYSTGCTHNHFLCCCIDHVRRNNVTNKSIVFDNVGINRNTLSSSFYLQILLKCLPNSSQSIIPRIDLCSSHINHIDCLQSYAIECIAIHKRLNRQNPRWYQPIRGQDNLNGIVKCQRPLPLPAFFHLAVTWQP